MAELITQVFNVVFPVLFCSAVGYAWVRWGAAFDMHFITPLLIYVAVPSLLLANLSTLGAAPSDMLGMLLAAILIHVVYGVLGYVIIRMGKLETRTWLPAMTFGNTGNLGLPLCLLAFGQEGLALGLGYMVVNTVGLFTVGVWIPSGRISPRDLLRSPTLYAVIVALTLGFTNIPMPAALHSGFDILGKLAIPLMLLALGAALARLQTNTLRLGMNLALIKSVLNMVVALLLAWVLGLEGMVRNVFILQSAMPVAVFNYLFAAHFGENAEQVAGLILASSLLGLVMIPGVLAILL